MPRLPSRGWTLGVAALLVTLAGASPRPAIGQTVPVARVMAGKGFSDLYGFGVGASAGLEVPFIRGKRFFVGVRGVYHFGTDGELGDLTDGDTGPPVGAASQLQTGLEIGATWLSSPVFIRTIGGVGVARVRVDLESGESDLQGINYKLQYGPGLLVALPASDGRFAGLAIRWLKVGGIDSTLAVYATFGKRIL